ncbi:DUF2207 domain-containing protein, partial [archaeon]|nr:DUF2207 domain-containing protein [archaeon]
MRKKAVMVISLLLLSTALAKSYYYESINLNVTVKENGDLIVTEEETLVFDGSFTYVYRSFYKPVHDFKVSDEQGKIDYERKDNRYKWTGSWNDESKTFTLEYTIKDPFKVTRSYDLLWHTIIFKDRNVKVKSSTSYFNFPEPINLNETSYRLSRQGAIKRANNTTLRIESDSIPANTALDFEITLPKGVIEPPLTLKNLRTLNPEVVDALAMLPFILIAWLVFKSYKAYFKEKKEQEKSAEFYKEVRAEDLPPAIAGLLIDYHSGVKEVTATIIDLAVRGYIYMQKVVKSFWPDETILVKTKDNLERLNDYEKKIMNTIFKEEKEVKMKDLQRKFNPRGSTYYTPLKRIEDLIQREAVKEGLAKDEIKELVRTKSLSITKYLILALVLTIPYFFLGTMIVVNIQSLFFITSAVFILLEIVSLASLGLLGTQVIKLTAKGYGSRRTYKKLKKFIKEQPLTEGRVFDTYLPYA